MASWMVSGVAFSTYFGMEKEVVSWVDGNSHERRPFFGLTGTRGGLSSCVSTARIEAEMVSYGKSSGWGIPLRQLERLDRSPPAMATVQVSTVRCKSLTHPLEIRILVQLLERARRPIPSERAEVMAHVHRLGQTAIGGSREGGAGRGRSACGEHAGGRDSER